MNRLKGICASALLASTAFTVPAFSQDGEGAAATAKVKPGRMLYVTKAVPLAPIYSVTHDGSPQVLMEGRRITIPASTISEVEGKLVTSLAKREILEPGARSPN